MFWSVAQVQVRFMQQVPRHFVHVSDPTWSVWNHLQVTEEVLHCWSGQVSLGYRCCTSVRRSCCFRSSSLSWGGVSLSGTEGSALHVCDVSPTKFIIAHCRKVDDVFYIPVSSKELTNHSVEFIDTLWKWSLDIQLQVINFWSPFNSRLLPQLLNVSQHKNSVTLTDIKLT